MSIWCRMRSQKAGLRPPPSSFFRNTFLLRFTAYLHARGPFQHENELLKGSDRPSADMQTFQCQVHRCMHCSWLQSKQGLGDGRPSLVLICSIFRFANKHFSLRTAPNFLACMCTRAHYSHWQCAGGVPSTTLHASICMLSYKSYPAYNARESLRQIRSAGLVQSAGLPGVSLLPQSAAQHRACAAVADVHCALQVRI